MIHVDHRTPLNGRGLIVERLGIVLGAVAIAAVLVAGAAWLMRRIR